MTQPPYRPSDDHATRRLVIFIAVFLVIVAIGSQSQTGHRGTRKSHDSMCVCLPSRASLMLKSALAKAQAHSTVMAAVTQK
ncbi:hypothetical protein [Tunturiibacter gelidiferens]|uniref:hypothetical protein n=1 Tax=Tunturiibacter gelidiferens TaxID=3069689 RepID=UPI003D9B1337